MNPNRKLFVRKDWKVWSPKNHPLPKTPDVYYRISLCTVCHGRSYDLKQTILQNIKDNEDYPNLEFVILNYNSPDDLHQFMISEIMLPHLRSGRVRYLVTNEPQYYASSRSRNIAMLNSTGDLVSCLDADNFTGKGFATYLNLLANICPRQALFTKSKWRNHGRIAMFKNEFIGLGGYDEELTGYGWEDYSLQGRALRSGFTLMWWLGGPVDFSKRILTPKPLVSSHMQNVNWQQAETSNKLLTLDKINRMELIVNKSHNWGKVNDLMVIT